MRVPKRSQLLALPLAIAVGLSATAVGQMSGKILLGSYKPAKEPSKRPSYNWELENGFKEVRPERVEARRELAVVLLGEGDPKGLDRVEVAFAGGSLMPSTIVVRTGATVLFRNDDEIAHELFAPGLAGLAAEATSPRGRRSVSLPTAGAWPLRDRVITHVAGHLYVFADLVAVATVDAEGQFSFKDVPPGKYTLKILHGDKEVASQQVELGSRPLTISPIMPMASPESK